MSRAAVIALAVGWSGLHAVVARSQGRVLAAGAWEEHRRALAALLERERNGMLGGGR